MCRRFVGTLTTFTSLKFVCIFLEIVLVRVIIGGFDEFGPFAVNKTDSLFTENEEIRRKQSPGERGKTCRQKENCSSIQCAWHLLFIIYGTLNAMQILWRYTSWLECELSSYAIRFVDDFHGAILFNPHLANDNIVHATIHIRPRIRFIPAG